MRVKNDLFTAMIILFTTNDLFTAMIILHSDPCKLSLIDLVTVLEDILTSRQLRGKLQCLYECLKSNNFRKMALLEKYEL